MPTMHIDIISSIAQPHSTTEVIILHKHATCDMNQCGEIYGIENDHIHNTGGLKCGDESTNHSRQRNLSDNPTVRRSQST